MALCLLFAVVLSSTEGLTGKTQMYHALHQIIFCVVVIPAASGSWQPWGEWSQCSASCGQGSRWRNRACAHSGCGGGNGHCIGDPVEAEVCKTADCKGMSCTYSFFPSHTTCCSLNINACNLSGCSIILVWPSLGPPAARPSTQSASLPESSPPESAFS